MELASIWAGLRLDLYEVLRRHGPVTVDELAELAGIDARYAREWLEQQAVAGLLDVEDPGQDAASRRYRLPDAHADVLLDADHPAHAGATAWWIGSLAEVLQRIPDVYRSGAGLPYPEERPVVDLWPDAGRALGLRRTSTYNAFERGELPFPVWKIRGRYVVPTAALRVALGLPTTPPMAADPAASQPQEPARPP